LLLLFSVCFGVGLGYTVIGFLVGEISDLFHFDFSISTNHNILPAKTTVMAAFLTVFGGCGMLFYHRYNIIVALILSLLIAKFVSHLMYRYVLIPLYAAQNTSTLDKESFIGSDARVTETIPQGGYGKITYHMNGNTYSSPAKSNNGSEISRTKDVIITKIEKNAYYVKEIEIKNQNMKGR
jgi:membrane protein implicated in regulation of membrane protease activity